MEADNTKETELPKIEVTSLIGECEVSDINIGKNETAIKYSLKEFPDRLLHFWAKSEIIVIYKSEVQLRRFIEDAWTIKNFKQEMYFGMISDELAKRIRNDINCDNLDDKIKFDLTNYSCVLPADAIRHAFYGHGNEEHEEKYGQRAITVDDIINFPKIIQEYDSVELSPKCHLENSVLVFKKVLGSCTTAITYVSARHKSLVAQTIYAKKYK